MNFLKSLLEKLILSVISLFVISVSLFAVFEWKPELPGMLGLTQIPYYALKDRYLADPELVFRMKPGYRYRGFFTGDQAGLFDKTESPAASYQADFDEEGFRNTQLKGSPEIAVIGDSMMEFGLDERDPVPARLAEISRRKTANYALGWYGPAQYLKVLERSVLPRNPKTVVLAFFEGNDLRDLGQYLNWERGGTYYHFSIDRDKFFSRYFAALRDSFIFFAKLAGRHWDPRKAQIRLADRPFETIFSYPLEKRSPDVLRESAEGKKLTETLAAFRDLCKAKNIQPFLVFIPSKTHLWGDYIVNPNEDLKAQIAAKNHLRNFMKETASTLGLPLIDLTEEMEARTGAGEILYYIHDTHWNEKARQLAAEEVWEAIKSAK